MGNYHPLSEDPSDWEPDEPVPEDYYDYEIDLDQYEMNDQEQFKIDAAIIDRMRGGGF